MILENPDYAEAAIGLTTEGNLVYSFGKMVEHLINVDNMSADDAREFIEYNTERAIPYLPDPKPIILLEFYK